MTTLPLKPKFCHTCNTDYVPKVPITAHSEEMLLGLNILRLQQKLFDVTLIVEERKFKAHRVVLAACSEYFATMFNANGFIESRQSEIHLHGISANGIEMLLEYAYTGKLQLDANNVQDVLAASSHIQMQSVIEACAKFLNTQFDLDNFIAIASLAELYSLNGLKNKVYRYICSHLLEFGETPDFLNLSSKQLKHILSYNYPVNCSEKQLLLYTLHYCHENKLSFHEAADLLHLIRYYEIDKAELSIILSKYADSPALSLNTLWSGMIKVRQKEYFKKLKKYRLKECDKEYNFFDDDDDDDDSDEAVNFYMEDVVPKIVVNMRGMELALVKIGGFELNGITNEISCFLPSKGKWENLTVIPHVEQCNYGTAVLGNELYIVGGSYDVSLKEYMHPFGFRYSATEDKWRTMAPMRFDRCRFSLNAIGNNYLYAVGGAFEPSDIGDRSYQPAELASYNCERYNALTDKWERLPTLPENRSQHAGVVLGDKLYISGGFDRHVVLSSLWCFDTKTCIWEQLCPMPTARADHSLTAIDDNRIYACGGWYEDPDTEVRVLNHAIDVYDVNTNQWIMETCNPKTKFYMGVAAIQRRIYFIGGLLSQPGVNRTSSDVQCYDVDKKQWICKAEWVYPKEVWECTCVALYIPREREENEF